MIGTMGSFAYPSADLNDPLYVLFQAIVSSLLAVFEPQDVRGNKALMLFLKSVLRLPCLL